MSAASPWSRDIAVGLAGSGHDVRIVDFQNTDGEAYLHPVDPFQARAVAAFTRQFEIHSFHGGRHAVSGCVPLALALRKMLRRTGPDLLLTLYAGRFAAAAYLCGFRPFAVYVAGSDILIGGRAKRLATRHILSAATVVIANGGYLAGKTREIAPRANIVALCHGTDTMKFSPGCPPSLPIRVVCTRGFLEIYNNRLLIESLSTMGNLLGELEVVFAAPGPLLAPARELADRILSPQQRKRVRFLDGASRDEMAELLQASHIYVSCSRSDGTSTSLMEALACGLFPVLSDIPPNREWIDTNAANGILTRVDDAPALGGALVHAARDRELRARAATFNRRLILERADLRTNMSRLGRMLEAHASSSARSRAAAAWAKN